MGLSDSGGVMEVATQAAVAAEAEELKKLAALMTGLSEAPLGEVLQHLTAEDASNLAALRSHVGALGAEDAAKTLRAFISMMMGAMDVPVATACLVEQADVAADVVAAELEPAEQAPAPTGKKCKIRTSAEKRMKPVLWDHHNDFLDAEPHSACGAAGGQSRETVWLAGR